jgi:hypothetical protein
MPTAMNECTEKRIAYTADIRCCMLHSPRPRFSAKCTKAPLLYLQHDSLDWFKWTMSRDSRFQYIGLWHIAEQSLQTAYVRKISGQVANARCLVFTANCRKSTLSHFFGTIVMHAKLAVQGIKKANFSSSPVSALPQWKKLDVKYLCIIAVMFLGWAEIYVCNPDPNQVGSRSFLSDPDPWKIHVSYCSSTIFKPRSQMGVRVKTNPLDLRILILRTSVEPTLLSCRTISLQHPFTTEKMGLWALV